MTIDEFEYYFIALQQQYKKYSVDIYCDYKSCVLDIQDCGKNGLFTIYSKECDTLIELGRFMEQAVNENIDLLEK